MTKLSSIDLPRIHCRASGYPALTNIGEEITMAKAVDKAYQTVRDRIVRGVYPASSRITEQEVAAVAGVSRTPVREALRKLHAEGLLEFVPHQGAIVTEWTSEDRDDVFELRALLESYGAARAARRMTSEGITELRQ